MATFEATYGLRQDGKAGVTVRGTRTVLAGAGYLSHLEERGADHLARQMCAEAARMLAEDTEHGSSEAQATDAPLPRAVGEQVLNPLTDAAMLDTTHNGVVVQLVESTFDTTALRQVSSIVLDLLVEPDAA